MRRGETVDQRRPRRGIDPTAVASGVGQTILVGAIVLLRRTWRHLLPIYWTAAALGLAWTCSQANATWGANVVVAVPVASAIAVAICPARSHALRMWRVLIPVVLGVFAVVTVALGPDAMASHAAALIAGPTVVGLGLGWPWWHHQASRRRRPPMMQPVAAPPPQEGDPLTERWTRRWATDVVGNGICAHTRLVHASVPVDPDTGRARDGIVETTLRLEAGTTARQLMGKGSDVEVALDLNAGSVGWQPTAKATAVRLVIVNRSYITAPVPWTGPTYADGTCRPVIYADGTPGRWNLLTPRLGARSGLVVGSTGSGKSRTLGVLIRNLLEGGWMVVVGDPQEGQSLPDWQDAVGEYHDSPEAVERVIRRAHAEVKARSRMLAEARVTVYDPADPRVKALGLRPLMLVIDECQEVLTPNNQQIVELARGIAATGRKAGVAMILATQIPQLTSLGGSQPLRDALVAGNCWIGQINNAGSGTLILPPNFVGDPFSIPSEIDGRPTAGMGYLREGPRVGMLSRVPFMDESAESAACAELEFRRARRLGQVEWLVDEPLSGHGETSSNGGISVADEVRALFGVPVPPKQSTEQWILSRLTASTVTAAALLDRPDCTVKQSRLYEVLKALEAAGKVTKRGDTYALVTT